MASAVSSDDNQHAGMAGHPYDPDACGKLSLAALDRMFAGMWDREHNAPRVVAPPSMPPDPFCPAVLFALPDALAWLRDDLIRTGTPVHPRYAACFDPVQGPAPLRCALEPHPEGTWHWDGSGTWFR